MRPAEARDCRRSCEAEEAHLGGVGDQAPLVVAVRTEVPQRHLRRGVPLSRMAGQIGAKYHILEGFAYGWSDEQIRELLRE